MRLKPSENMQCCQFDGNFFGTLDGSVIVHRNLELQCIESTYCVAGPGEARNVLAVLEPLVLGEGDQGMIHTILVWAIT